MPSAFLSRFSLVLVLGLLGCAKADAEKKPNPPARKPQVAISQSDGHHRVVVLRPATSRMHLEDEIRLVLHVESQNQNGERSPAPRTTITTLPTLTSLTITATAPGGKEQTLRIDASKTPQGLPEKMYAPSLVLTLNDNGVAFDSYALYHSQPAEFSWKDNATLSTTRNGIYHFSISGELHEEGGRTEFSVGPIKIERGAMGLPPSEKLIAKARVIAARDGDVPQLKEQGKASTHPWVIENDKGHHTVVLLAPDRGWSQRRFYVTFDPQGEHVATAHRAVGTCVAEGTMIQSASGPVKVQGLRIGQRVWGFDVESQQRVLVNVVALRSHVAPSVLQIGDLQVTAEHPILAGGAFIPAADLKAGDELLTFTGDKARVGQIETLPGPIAVYDVTVSGVHNYFAGGVLVHNKDRDYWPHVDDAYYILWPTEQYLPERLPTKE